MMSRALFCSFRLTVETGGAIYHLLSEKMARSVEKFRGYSLAGQGQDLPPRWLGSETLTTLLRNGFAPPPPDSSARTHINIVVYPSFPTKIAYYGKLVSPPPFCNYL